ncbi:MAG: c-type cytochrome [Actinomycetes bacterium]|jgi:mono/diheme cytochrome c family protein
MIASTSASIAWLVLLASLAGWIIYGIANVRGGRKEVGSEQTLAANRKPYYDDEELEGKRLERTQLIGLLFLAIVTVALPLYWIMEPSRQEEAVFGFEKRFVKWGGKLFAATADGGYNCAGCHGGMKATGGVAPYAITDPKTNEVKAVSWKAPSLNTVMYRYSAEEVRFILNYGRPFSPMSAWGTVGGGPLTDQAVDTLINYIESIQVPQENCTTTRGAFNPTCDTGMLPKEKNDELSAEAKRLVDNGTYSSMGEAYFNLDLGGGAYSCARCHTKGWSYGDPQVTGGGAFGPNLTAGSSVRQFPSADDMVTFLKAGSQMGQRYGEQGQGSGRMPGFGHVYTDEQIRQIVEYVRSL